MQSFAIVPANTGYMWLLPAIIGIVMLGVVALVVGTTLGARNSTFDVSAQGLRLRGDWYGRLIPASALKLDSARRVDFASEPKLTPSWRTMGTALPGYSAGWFKLRNGEKALLYLTDRSRAVYLPTTAGYSLLLSPEDPDGFLAAVRALR